MSDRISALEERQIEQGNAIKVPVQLANTKRRTITFEYCGANVWEQVGAATGDM